MPQLVIHDLEDAVLQRLQQQASMHGRSAEVEASAILTYALQAQSLDPWAAADAIRQQLAGSGQGFSDSAELVREDRDR